MLVGGQAIGFWDSYFFADERDTPPLTSKDLDFVGSRQDVRGCAQRLDGTAIVATIDDITPSAGVVRFIDAASVVRDIDVMETCFGVDDATLHRTAVEVELLEDDGTGSGKWFRVMHPVLCLQSRVSNTMGLPGYETPHALRQVAASIRCARTYLERVLLPTAGARPVLDWNEAIFRFVTRHRHGRMMALRHPTLDPFDAVLLDHRLPREFVDLRYPQMVRQVEAFRHRHRPTP